MTQRQYRLNIRYIAMPLQAPRRRKRLTQLAPSIVSFVSREPHRPHSNAIMGMLVGAPIAAIMWVPIVWALSHVF